MGHLLVVDDAEDLRLLMRLALEGAGHRVSVAAGGREALAQLDELDDVDAVILDVQMPAVDGWMILEAIRSHPRHHGIGVLMCTVKFSRADLVRAWSLGCDGYLSKPFDLHALCATVDQLLAADPSRRIDVREEQLAALAAAAHRGDRR